MENGSRLQVVTGKLLDRVEVVLDEGNPGLSDLKQMAAVLKDIRDVQKETAVKDTPEPSVRVILEGDVAQYGA